MLSERTKRCAPFGIIMLAHCQNFQRHYFLRIDGRLLANNDNLKRAFDFCCRSRSHDGRIVPTGNHLAVPNTNNNRVVPSPTLPHRLMLPGDSGSCYSIQSRGSSPGPHTPSIIPGELANGGLSQHSSVYSAQLVGDWSFNGGGKIPNGFHQTSLG